jgi:hypothetical protein
MWLVCIPFAVAELSIRIQNPLPGPLEFLQADLSDVSQATVVDLGDPGLN